MADVSLQGVSRSFGSIEAVSNLSLDIADGELVVLLGPTGAGKTTTLRLLAGLEKPDSGSIAIGGIDMTDAQPAARDVAFVFQQYSLYPHLSVFDNLAFPLRAPGQKARQKLTKAEIETRVTEIATLLRIDSKLRNPATRLSGGEMQRVAIGRALVRTPSVYLMDEPLSSLDAKLREDLRIELKRIQKDLGTTILYVTHDQLEAMTLADRVGVLSEGRLVQVGTPREVYEQPATVEVARRLGSPQINLLSVGALGVETAPAGCTRIGVRPEDVVPGHGSVEATVTNVEHLGAEMVVLMDVGGDAVHALVSSGAAGVAPTVGETTRVGVRDGAALYFGADDHRVVPT